MSEAEYIEALSEAWTIINVLTMHTLDEGEPYPRALFWLRENEQFRSPPFKEDE